MPNAGRLADVWGRGAGMGNSEIFGRVAAQPRRAARKLSRLDCNPHCQIRPGTGAMYLKPLGPRVWDWQAGVAGASFVRASAGC